MCFTSWEKKIKKVRSKSEPKHKSWIIRSKSQSTHAHTCVTWSIRICKCSTGQIRCLLRVLDQVETSTANTRMKDPIRVSLCNRTRIRTLTCIRRNKEKQSICCQCVKYMYKVQEMKSRTYEGPNTRMGARSEKSLVSNY